MNFENFVNESNRIEGILRPPLSIEVDGTRMFVEATSPPSPSDVATLALIYAPNKGFLREQEGMDVRVGSHVAPKGGPLVVSSLTELLATTDEAGPIEFHVAYETLHPFMDGNGRTGRALWAWQMFHRGHFQAIDRGFLHSFYYQVLEASRDR